MISALTEHVSLKKNTVLIYMNNAKMKCIDYVENLHRGEVWSGIHQIQQWPRPNVDGISLGEIHILDVTTSSQSEFFLREVWCGGHQRCSVT